MGRRPTLLAAAGEPNVVAKLESKEGYKANGKSFRIHPDGFNFLPFFKGEAKKGPREQILYFGQGGELNAVRWNDWAQALKRLHELESLGNPSN